jgi:hypothetical protein
MKGGLGAFWTLITSVLALALAASVYIQFRRVRHGCVLPGTVVRCSEPLTSDETVRFDLTYRLIAPDGAAVEGTQNVTRSSNVPTLQPDATVKLAVLFLSNTDHEVL